MSRVVKTLSASRRLSSTRAWKARSSASAFGREGVAVPDLLGRELHQVLVDDVADMLEIGGEGQDLDVALAVLLAELVARGLDEVELDRLVEPVDGVVGRLDRLHRLGIVALEDVHRLAQHVGHAVAEIQRLAQRAAQRLGRACRGRWDRDGAACRDRRPPAWRAAGGAERGDRRRSAAGRRCATATLKAVWKLTGEARRRRIEPASATAGRGPRKGRTATPTMAARDQVGERHAARRRRRRRPAPCRARARRRYWRRSPGPARAWARRCRCRRTTSPAARSTGWNGRTRWRASPG